MKAYVLAAGYATRMYPLTRDVPKALLEVGGRPILDHLVGKIQSLEGLSEIVIVTNARFFPRFHAWNEQRATDLPITLIDDGTTSNDDRLGAVADLELALDCVPLEGEDAFVVASDNLFDGDLRRVQASFATRGAPTLIARRVGDPAELAPYNELALEDDGRVVRFVEKPVGPTSRHAAIAAYFFPPGILADLSGYLETGNPDAPGYFVAWLVDRYPCYAEPLAGRWFDIGSLETLEQARREWGPGG